ncbi:LPXTG cell wall anchor domain-containing protein [Streptomyces sp. SID13666]|uniref:LPXTG cell wall anchor domain-containing protein n=1 Tax=unclassified Streptomyces TaxID=2593676 RepID=UPI0013C22064|nr:MULTISPECIES: LPXTG cell wall anchor domain-containing protein [unclassified Streptomyces]NEA52918.1 LPXTG cell wall anchor domain-containing protein [Streptomyces sp. SID13666]NEA69755.1 LPXTG cell wall anchor domain-containing protein [Streptomyces sp. SID13588]
MPLPSLRLLRPLTAALLITLTTLLSLLPTGPASAHGDTIHLEITGNAEGRLTVTATWDEDHHPVDEKVAATLQATAADGRQVGPWALTPLDMAQGTYTVAVPLPPGTWQIAAESAFPAIGAGRTTLKVTAVPGRPAPSTSATTPAPPVSAAPATSHPAQPTAAADTGGSGSSSTLLLGAAAGVVVAAAAALLIVRRRRSGSQG